MALVVPRILGRLGSRIGQQILDEVLPEPSLGQVGHAAARQDHAGTVGAKELEDRAFPKAPFAHPDEVAHGRFMIGPQGKA